MKSQTEQIKAHLEAGHSITSLDALRRFGCLRLSGRIYELVNDHGLNVASEMISVNGKRIARYYIPGKCSDKKQASLKSIVL